MKSRGESLKIDNVQTFVRNELIDFTRLSPETVDLYLSRKKYPQHQLEWNFWKPDSDENIRWFYVTSRSYIFTNATHRLHPNIVADIPSNSNALDFGGGSGNYSYSLVNKDCNILYFDISLLQNAFVQFVTSKYKLPITLLSHDEKFMPNLGEEIVDVILALDVLEHVPDYHEYIKLFSQHSHKGTKIYLFAPFGAGGDPTHLQDRSNCKNEMANNGFNFGYKIPINHGANCSVYIKEY